MKDTDLKLTREQAIERLRADLEHRRWTLERDRTDAELRQAGRSKAKQAGIEYRLKEAQADVDMLVMALAALEKQP